MESVFFNNVANLTERGAKNLFNSHIGGDWQTVFASFPEEGFDFAGSLGVQTYVHAPCGSG